MVRKPEEGRGLVGHGEKLGSCAHRTGGNGSLRLLCGDWSIGGQERKLGEHLGLVGVEVMISE